MSKIGDRRYFLFLWNKIIYVKAFFVRIKPIEHIKITVSVKNDKPKILPLTPGETEADRLDPF